VRPVHGREVIVPNYWFFEIAMRNLGARVPYTGKKAPCCILRPSKDGGIMYTLTVITYVLENETESFLQKTMECARATRGESGNLRYDVLQNEDHPDCFVIYEVYRSKEDFLFHRETPHSQTWKAETEPILAKPRARIRCHSLYFSD
jgi:(4S)-4-hydroxy-5-phosphonooxypentane-2,3-dione isomerase